jgi:type 1 glutamine amidotransferase
MNRQMRARVVHAAVSLLIVCQGQGCDPVPLDTPSSGNAGAMSSGAAGPGGAGSPSMTAGSSGALSAGGMGGTAGAGTGAAGTAGAMSSGGSGGAGATGGSASGNGGSGGTGPMLPKRVLLYHFSTLAIGSLAAQLTLLTEQLKSWGFEVKDSVSPADLSAESLATFGGVGMINTCFEPFGKDQMGAAETAALTSFVDNGGGLFGTHCASVTFQTAEPPHAYNALIGGRGGDGYYEGTSACRTTEQHPTTAMLPGTFEYTGNLDNADFVAPDTKVLVECQWSGGEQKKTAVSWYRTPGKGRVFYTNFAKEDKDLSDATLGDKHILLGLSWVLQR